VVVDYFGLLDQFSRLLAFDERCARISIDWDACGAWCRARCAVHGDVQGVQTRTPPLLLAALRRLATRRCQGFEQNFKSWSAWEAVAPDPSYTPPEAIRMVVWIYWRTAPQARQSERTYGNWRQDQELIEETPRC